MIERHVTFNVVPEKTTEFEQFFMHEYRPAMSSMAGFVKVALLRNQDQPSQYCMVISFDSTQNASAWRASAEHQALKPELSSLYHDSSLKVYEVVT